MKYGNIMPYLSFAIVTNRSFALISGHRYRRRLLNLSTPIDKKITINESYFRYEQRQLFLNVEETRYSARGIYDEP